MLPEAAAAAAAAAEGGGAAVEGAGVEGAAEECPICFEDMEAPTTTSCGHQFCSECIVNTLNLAPDAQDQLCPVCRTQITIKGLRRLADAAPADAGGGGGQGLRGICGRGSGVSDATRASFGATVLESKFRLLVHELALVRQKDPAAKSLVKWRRRRRRGFFWTLAPTLS